MSQRILIYIVSSAFLVLFIIACNSPQQNTKVVEQKYPSNKPKLISEYKVVDGVKTKAKEVKLYEDGKKEYEGEIANDKRNGYWVYYYSNGNKWSEGYFKNGFSNGARTVYYEKGGVRYSGFFTDGRASGIWLFYDENGKVVKKINYSDTGERVQNDIPEDGITPKQN